MAGVEPPGDPRFLSPPASVRFLGEDTGESGSFDGALMPLPRVTAGEFGVVGMIWLCICVAGADDLPPPAARFANESPDLGEGAGRVETPRFPGVFRGETGVAGFLGDTTGGRFPPERLEGARTGDCAVDGPLPVPVSGARGWWRVTIGFTRMGERGEPVPRRPPGLRPFATPVSRARLMRLNCRRISVVCVVAGKARNRTRRINRR